MTKSLIYLIAIFCLWFYFHITGTKEKAPITKEENSLDISIADELVPNLTAYEKGQVNI